jgi:hypothetical protein
MTITRRALFEVLAGGLVVGTVGEIIAAPEILFSDGQPMAVRQREGWAVPITFHRGQFRMNVTIVTNNLPQGVWDSPNFLGTGQTFPVSVWRIREGRATSLYLLLLPKTSVYSFQFPVGPQFDKGDLLVVEYSPGLLKAPGVPFASLVDNVSNDPVTVPLTIVFFADGQGKRRSV